MRRKGKTLEGHTFEVRCVDMSKDGRIIVSWSGDKTGRIWDTEGMVQVGKPLRGDTNCRIGYHVLRCHTMGGWLCRDLGTTHCGLGMLSGYKQ